MAATIAACLLRCAASSRAVSKERNTLRPANECNWMPSDWTYLSEGNLHVVFSFAGTDLPLRGKVLRLRKFSDKPHTVSVCNSARFVTNVMQAHLGQEYVDAGCLVRLPAAFLREMARKTLVESRRPAHRVRGLDPSCLHGVLMRDYTRPPAPWFGRAEDDTVLQQTTGATPGVRTVCIEIKPKCGLLPPFPEGEGNATPPCRFCQHQALKLKQKKVERESEYCPLGLYSGAIDCDVLRLSDALRGLLATPQNNLQVFGAGGSLLYGENFPTSEKEKIADGDPSGTGLDDDRRWQLRRLQDVCCKLYPGTKHLAAVAALVRDVCAVLITERKALQRLIKLQAKDTIGIAALAARVECLRQHQPSASSEQTASDTHWPVTIDDVEDPAIRALLGDFAVSTTAKDVSLMITIQNVTSTLWSFLRAGGGDGRRRQRTLQDPCSRGGALEWLDLARAQQLRGTTNGEQWVYSLAVCDLDPKTTTENLDKYVKLDQNISKAAAQRPKTGKLCFGFGHKPSWKQGIP